MCTIGATRGSVFSYSFFLLLIQHVCLLKRFWIPRAAFLVARPLVALVVSLGASQLSLLLALAAWQCSLSVCCASSYALLARSGRKLLSSTGHNGMCRSSLRDSRGMDFKINFKWSALRGKQVSFWFRVCFFFLLAWLVGWGLFEVLSL